jgi:hypothetical protein
MNKETRELLEQLAAKLGTTVDHLWQVLIAQARVEAISECIIFGVIFLLLIPAWIVSFKCYKKNKDDFDSGVIFMPVGAVTLFFLIVLCMSFTGIITGFYNPEYFALKEILRHL